MEYLRGLAVSGSQAMTLTSGLVGFIAEATPVISPPTPYGHITVSTCGKSSNISSPIVPCPVYIDWQRDLYCTNLLKSLEH